MFNGVYMFTLAFNHYLLYLADIQQTDYTYGKTT